MPIFKISNNKAKQVFYDQKHFINEAKLRDFFAENLEELLGMRFIAKEYETTDGRMDTIALDETNSPVIIEFKWGQDNAIVVQGLFYFDWLKKNKKHFDLLVYRKFGLQIKVNWDKPRIVLISQGFDNRTIAAVQHIENIELIKYSVYQNDILHLENLFSPKTFKKLKDTVASKNTDSELEYDEGVTYDLNYHFSRNNSSEIVKSTFFKIRDNIKSLPGIEELVDQKSGISYRTTKSFTRLEFGKNYINVLVREPKYLDPLGLVKDITSHMWGYKGKIQLKSLDEVNAVFDIIKQSYEDTL
jgi:predicted transport protein